MRKGKILVTGGLGFIGSHTVIELIHAGYEAVIIDDLSNAEEFILERIHEITGSRPAFYEADVSDKTALLKIFSEQVDITMVIHFAAYKAVAESVKYPLKYFTNNLISLLHLLEIMQTRSCLNLVFSSSATVYGDPDKLPVTENTVFKKALSAYGSTKQMGEEILEKIAANGSLQVISLRYFNPVGAHESALIGELPNGVPNNLMPYISQAAIGMREELIVYGNDYNTNDGTCIRDYIHVVDLAKAHVKACDCLLQKKSKSNFEVVNIGTGKGLSVLEVINTFERINKVKVPYRIGPKRTGDVAENYADISKAASVLGWKAERTIDDMVKDTWQWQLKQTKTTFY